MIKHVSYGIMDAKGRVFINTAMSDKSMEEKYLRQDELVKFNDEHFKNDAPHKIVRVLIDDEV